MRFVVPHVVRARARAARGVPCAPTSVARRNEAGFTVVEVVIAVIVLGAVVTAVTLASVGGSKLRGAAKLQAAITASGLQVQEDIATNRAWMDRPACRNLSAYCTVVDVVKQPDSLVLKGIGSSSSPAAVELVWARAQAIDSDIDLKGALDKDGVIPDFFKVDIRIRVEATVATRYDSTPAKLTRDLTTTIDRRGREQTGSLAVEICRVTNQVDERMSLQGCADSGDSGIRMNGCPPTPRPGCDAAWNWIAGRAKNPSTPAPFVMIRRIGASSMPFSVVNASTGRSYPSSSAKDVGGILVFQDLPAGGYQVNGLPWSVGAGTERWSSKELPQFHGAPGHARSGGESAIVEPGLRNRALVVYRPNSGTTGRIGIHADREVHDYRLNGELHTTEMVVPVDTPTSSYLGGSAAAACAAINASIVTGSVDCIAVVPGPGPNCASVQGSGAVYEYVGMGNGTHFRDPGGYHEQDPGDLIQHNFTNQTVAFYCTTYSEEHTYTYWAATGPGGAYYLPGAVAGLVQPRIEPKPDNRRIEVTGGVADLSVADCIIAGHTLPSNTQCTNGGIIDLSPGLNSGLLIPPSHAGANEQNTNRVDFPAWLKNPIWVHTDGRLETSEGVKAKDTTVSIRGLGECYWTSPRYAGKQVGPCSRCSPIWTPGTQMGGCSILTFDAVVRVVVEHSTFVNLLTGAASPAGAGAEIARDAYGIPFSPPWRCSTSVPSLKAQTCSRQATGGGGAVTNRGGSYTSPATGGTAIVDSAPIQEGGA